MQSSRAALVLAVLYFCASTGLAQRGSGGGTTTEPPADSAPRAPAPVSRGTASAPRPSSCSTVAQTASDAGLTTLLAAVDAAGLTSTLSDPSLKYTVFAPTNDAFTEALAALGLTAPQLLASPSLKPILQNHLLAFPIPAADLITYKTVTTQYNESPLNITATTVGGETVVEVSTPVVTANVIKANIAACQSIVHVVDQVLVPEIEG